MNSISSALPPLSTQRGGTRAEYTAEFPQNTRVGANTDGAAWVIDEVSGQTRTHVDGFGMQQPPELCAITLSASGKRLSNPLLRVRSEATQQHRTPLSLRYGMGVAMISAMRVADPSAQPRQEEAE